MLPRIENQSSMHLATTVRGQAARQSSQVFSDLLAGESAGAHLVELPKTPVETPKPEADGGSSRQNPVTSLPSSQVFDTLDTGTPHFDPLAIFRPKDGSGGSSAGTQPSPSASTANPPFVPKFQQNLEVVSAYGGSSALNPIYFATPETAQWIANKYGTGEVVARPYDATSGPYSANGTEYYIRVQNGSLVNAGLLADCYQRMSAAEADTIIRQGLSEA
jgi:hypothetical protein